ncbi:MAG: TatD family hydrolase [Chloroflexi bacterium]|nr:TatD family hydrolase [Chloroflexota bacterium]
MTLLMLLGRQGRWLAERSMLVDAHTHLDHYSDEQLGRVVAEIETHQILTLSNSMDVPSYRRNQAIAGRCERIIPSFGIHPWQAAEYVDKLEAVRPLLAESRLLGKSAWITTGSKMPRSTRRSGKSLNSSWPPPGHRTRWSISIRKAPKGMC